MATAFGKIRLRQPRLWQRVTTLLWARRALWLLVPVLIFASIDPRAPTRLPLLFALDKKFNIAGGYRYEANCNSIDRASGSNVYCGSDFSSGSSGASGDSDGFGGSDSTSSSGGSGDGGSDGGGSGCGGGD